MIVQNRFTEWLAERLVKFARRKIQKAPSFVIGQDGDPYMKRWWVIPRNRLLNIYLHEFVRSDDPRALHDHPWASCSIALGEVSKEYYRWGEMIEIYNDKNEVEQTRPVSFGSIVFRGGKFAHRMVVPYPGFCTIFITGPRFRDWGFLCPSGWTRWQDFTAPSEYGKIGKGCGE